MSNFPSIGSGQSPAGFSDAAFSGSTARRGISSYESMDAGLTIKTREGDIVTLSTSRYSELNAHEYSSQGYLETQNGSVLAQTYERSIELSTGEQFSFSVQGDLNDQELADIESIVSGIDGIIYEMAEGDMNEAMAQALSMGSYASVSSYEADITVAHAYSEYAQTSRSDMGTSLPAYGNDWANTLPYATSPFISEISTLLEAQDAAALAHARQPLSQLFDHYLDMQDLNSRDSDSRDSDSDPDTQPQSAELADSFNDLVDLSEAGGNSDLAATSETAGKSPAALALESTAKMVDRLIQDMVRDAFEHTLDQMI